MKNEELLGEALKRLSFFLRNRSAADIRFFARELLRTIQKVRDEAREESAGP